MKKLFKLLAVALLVCLATPSVNAERLPMTVDKMPSQISLFLNEYYPGAKVKSGWAKMMRPTSEPMYYRVNLDNGTKMQFSLDGNWEYINSKASDAYVSIDLLPKAAREYISQNYPQQKIKCVKFKKDYYKVTLNNGDVLRFSKQYGFDKVTSK